ncbi:MAG: hypothetical protein R3C32_02630 [Chloroflexota bacterium]
MGDPRFSAHAERFYRRWSARPLAWADHLTPGLALVRLARSQDDATLLAAAVRLASWLREVPHTSTGLPLYRPDLGHGAPHTCWVDTLYHEGPPSCWRSRKPRVRPRTGSMPSRSGPAT